MPIKRDTVEARKALPIASGVLDYFPDALLAVAEVSRVGNEQHHPGQPLHWDKSKSTDEADALLRHLIDRGTLDTDGQRHSAKVAWRALAMLQRELDAEAAVQPAYFVLTGPAAPTPEETARLERRIEEYRHGPPPAYFAPRYDMSSWTPYCSCAPGATVHLMTCDFYGADE